MQGGPRTPPPRLASGRRWICPLPGRQVALLTGIPRKIEELELKTIPEITNAIKAGGVRVIEVTMTAPGALNVIGQNSSFASSSEKVFMVPPKENRHWSSKVGRMADGHPLASQ